MFLKHQQLKGALFLKIELTLQTKNTRKGVPSLKCLSMTFAGSMTDHNQGGGKEATEKKNAKASLCFHEPVGHSPRLLMLGPVAVCGNPSRDTQHWHTRVGP